MACLLSLYFGKSIPYFGIGSRELLAASFMLGGFYYKQAGFRWEERFYVIPIALVLLAVGTLYWQGSMLNLTWQKALPYTVSALAGTLMVFSISKAIRTKTGDSVLKRFIVYIGNHTLEILTWHFLSFKLISLLIIWVYSLPIVRLAEFPVIEEYAYKGWWIVYSIIGIGLPIIGLKFKKNPCKIINTSL